MQPVCGSLGTSVMRRRADPERERRTGNYAWNDIPALCVAGSETAVRWLTAICEAAGLTPPAGPGWPGTGILVLAYPDSGENLRALCRMAGARRAVVSLDCPEGRALAASEEVETFTFSEGRDAADLTAKNVRLTGSGLTFMAVTRDALARVTVPAEELYPALAVLAAACWIGVPLEQAAAIVSRPLE